MALTTQTKIGLSIGQILSVIIILVAMFAAYGNFAVRLATIEQNNLQLRKDLITLGEKTESYRNERNDQIQQLRTENTIEHDKLMGKTDKIYDYLLKK